MGGGRSNGAAAAASSSAIAAALPLRPAVRNPASSSSSRLAAGATPYSLRTWLHADIISFGCLTRAHEVMPACVARGGEGEGRGQARR